MSIEGNKKSFPFLRKGDGLSRYSSLKYPRYKKSYSTGNCQNLVPMTEDEPQAGLSENGHVGARKPTQEVDGAAAVGDSGRGSSAAHDESHDDHVHFELGATPKDHGDLVEPSLIDRRMAWEAREQRENLEANHFEALERFLAAMNSTLKSDCSTLYKAGMSTDHTPAREEAREQPTERFAPSPVDRISVKSPSDNPPTDHIISPPPPIRLPQLPMQNASSFNQPARWRFPQPDSLLPPSLLPPAFRPPFPFMDNARTNPPVNGLALMDMEKELRALMTSLERDADELQRRRMLLEEHTEATRKQLVAEWQSVEQEKELLKIQKMKIEQDKNDLLTFRARMEEEAKLKLEKCDKAQDELKMLQTECQLLKKKLAEQKKQSGEEISAVQQQVIDLQRQAVESDSRSSSFRTQITKLKEEFRLAKEEADSAKARIKLLESANERLRAENSQLRMHVVEQRDKLSMNGSNPVVNGRCLKPTLAGGDQGRIMQSQTSKCVRFADEPTTFRRTKDFCVQAAGPSDMATQTSFMETPPSLDNNCSSENNPILERAIGGGKKEIIYPNDTVQIRDRDGAETFNYASGDVLRCLPDGTKIYHSASDGRTEIRNPDGTLMVKNADGTSETYKFMPDGAEVVTYSNGTVVEKRPYGVEIAYLYDKSKETRCSHYTLREFPSGDVKKLFADGSTETRLICGRVRVKDAQGNVIKDTDEYPLRPPS